MADSLPPSRSVFERNNRLRLVILIGISTVTILAFFLRFWRLDRVPPGWRDDELINSLVISQKVLDGDWSLYYADASGHEALFHILTAATLALFGPGTAGIRGLPAFLGAITIPLSFLVASRMYGSKVGLLAAAGLAVSFWSLMYSRIGIRHISLPIFILASFYAFLRGMQLDYSNQLEPAAGDLRPARRQLLWFAAAGLFLGIGFYTYFASRGVPGILLGFIFYLLLFQRWRLRRTWKGLVLMFGLALLLALPLLASLNRQPGAEARVSELAAPLSQAIDGDFQGIFDHTSRTLRMFLNTGDDEWLYNIPFRPIFSGVGAIFFWAGVVIGLWYSLKPMIRTILRFFNRRTAALQPESHLEAVSAFLLIWWLVGISPAFVSVPAASFGHTIAAQPAAYILLALPLLPLEKLSTKMLSHRLRPAISSLVLPGLAGLILMGSLAYRDLPDYFIKWPWRGMVRFLYRADIKDLADYVEDHRELNDFGVSSLLAGPWDKLAFDIDFDDDREVRPRWYNPERALLISSNDQPAWIFTGYPIEESPFEALYQPVVRQSAGAYQLSMVDYQDEFEEATCFRNGLCLLQAHFEDGRLDLIWEVKEPLVLPPMPLVSNPPPPDVYGGPRLSVFAQMLNDQGEFLIGDDGFWVDAETLQPGDRFIQRHYLSNPGNGATLIFGLYDPKTGDRLPTTDGRYQLELALEQG